MQSQGEKHHAHTAIYRSIGISLITLFLMAPCTAGARETLESSRKIERWWGKTPQEEKTNKHKALDLALKNLSSDDYQQQENAFYSLEMLGEQAVPGLIAIISGRQDGVTPKMQMDAIYAAGRIGAVSAPAVASITSALRDENPDKRAIAAVALGKIGRNAEGSVPYLIPLLNDKTPWVRESAATALDRIHMRKSTIVLAHYSHAR